MSHRLPSSHQTALAEYAEWEWNHAPVAAFIAQHGHAILGNHPAADWLQAQRLAARSGTLSQARPERLAALGIPLSPDDTVSAPQAAAAAGSWDWHFLV